MFLFDEHARLGSPREKFLTENIEKFRNTLGREKIDQVLKKKYEAYYSSILGKQIAVTTGDVEQVNKQLEALNLGNTNNLLLYQVAVSTYLTKDGGDKLFEIIKSTSGNITKDEMDIFLYFAIPSVNEFWTPEQTEQILTLINRDDIRSRITNTLNRQKQTLQPK